MISGAGTLGEIFGDSVELWYPPFSDNRDPWRVILPGSLGIIRPRTRDTYQPASIME